MKKDTMPAVEVHTDEEREHDQYECTFHVLPTIADGEVDAVVNALKKIVTDHQGEIFDAEEPQRFTLAYEIRRSIEGRSQRFTTSWLGWIRFSLSRAMLEKVVEEWDHRSDIIRHLTIRLTKEEVLNPQRVFEKKVEPATVLLREADSEVSSEVSEEDLNKSLEEITS